MVSGGLEVAGAHQRGAALAAEHSELDSAAELKAALRDGVEENLEQAARLERVFAAAGLPVERTADRAVRGIGDDTRPPTLREGAYLTLPLAGPQ